MNGLTSRPLNTGRRTAPRPFTRRSPMHFSGRMIVAGLLALAVVILAQQSGRTAESPLAGRWKLSEVGAKDTALVLLKLSDKDGQLQAEAVSSPLLKDTMKVRSIKLDKGVSHLALKFAGGPL